MPTAKDNIQAHALVPGEDPFVLMDSWDDEQIRKELQGQVDKAWVYEIVTSTGQKQRGLSKVGIDQASILLAKRGEVFRESSDVKIQLEPDACLVIVKAERWLVTPDKEVLLDTKLGVKRQSYTMNLKDGTVVENPFWFEQAVMKAARNAKRRFLSPEVEAEIVSQAYAEGRVRTQESRSRTNPIKQGESPKPEVSSNATFAPDDILQEIHNIQEQIGVSKDDLIVWGQGVGFINQNGNWITTKLPAALQAIQKMAREKVAG